MDSKMIGLLPVKGREHLRRVYSTDGYSVTINSARGGQHMPKFILEEGQRLRIRRFTPREVFRMMDFSDKDFEEAEAVNADVHLYSQAGNSICVNCLVAIFGQMIEGKENVYAEYSFGDE